MNSDDKTVISSSPGLHPPPEETPLCVNCAERNFLKTLVAELLYKNQALRFELRELEEHRRRIA